MLLKRASMLGKDVPSAGNRFRKATQGGFVSPEQFVENLPEPDELSHILNYEDAYEHISTVIFDAARQAKQSTPGLIRGEVIHSGLMMGCRRLSTRQLLLRHSQNPDSCSWGLSTQLIIYLVFTTCIAFYISFDMLLHYCGFFFNICRPKILELHDKHFSRCWPFVRRFHWSQVVAPHKIATVRNHIVLFCVFMYWKQTVDLPVDIKPMMRMWWHCWGKISFILHNIDETKLYMWSWNCIINASRIAGPLWGESIGNQWILLRKVQ